MNITVYSLPNCVQCDSTKRMFKQHSVDFNEVDLSTDMNAVKMVQELGYSSAPVVITDQEHWSGFRIEKIKHTIAEVELAKGHTHGPR